MRPRNLRCCLAFLFALPVGAQESLVASADKVPFRAAALGHDVLLRDGGRPAFPAKFPLPPGGQDLELQPTTSTPYDSYFSSVREVTSALEPQRASMVLACHLMKIGFSYQYVTRDLYRPDPPKLTQAQRAGDCKSKALWLYDNLADSGALYTIGKADKNSRTSHAWVYFRHDSRWWILDCTDRTDPIAADSVSADRYIPFYSFGKNGAYRHPSTKTFQSTSSSPTPAPAVGAPDRKKLR